MITICFVPIGKDEGKEYQFPEKENEFNQKHLEALALFVWTYEENKSNQLVQYIHLIRKLLAASGVSLRYFKKISEGQLYEELMPLGEKFVKENNFTNWVISKISDFPFTVYGPKDRLKNIILDEFVFAHSCYSNYIKTKKITWLDNLIAILYRPAKWYWPLIKLFPMLDDGDCRQTFNNHIIEKRAKLIHDLPLSLKFAILHNYQGCINYLVKTYPGVFSSAEQNKKKSDLSEIIIDCAGPIFGTVQQTRKTKLTEILKRLQKISESTEKNEE